MRLWILWFSELSTRHSDAIICECVALPFAENQGVQKTLHFFWWSGSNNSYKGPNTKTKMPTSRNASPSISAEYFISGKVTSVLRPKRYITGSLGCNQVSIFQIVRSNESQHRIAKQEGILAVIESPRHLI